MCIQIPSRFEIYDNMMLGHGNCLDLMQDIPDGSVDMCLMPIKGFRHYLISNNGAVFNTRTKKIKKSCKDAKGYLRVRLIDGARGETRKVHRLVAEAFLPDFSNDLQVNHKDCDKSNNNILNLEMANQSQNTKHAWQNNRMKLTKRGSDGKFTR